MNFYRNHKGMTGKYALILGITPPYSYNGQYQENTRRSRGLYRTRVRTKKKHVKTNKNMKKHILFGLQDNCVCDDFFQPRITQMSTNFLILSFALLHQDKCFFYVFTCFYLFFLRPHTSAIINKKRERMLPLIVWIVEYMLFYDDLLSVDDVDALSWLADALTSYVVD